MIHISDNPVNSNGIVWIDPNRNILFFVDEELLACDAVLLRCEGLDILATVSVNGTTAGSANNMYRIWEFDVKALLQGGENTITVHFASPTKYIKEAYAASVADGSSDAIVGVPHIRKAHCMFGWDWGPGCPVRASGGISASSV